MALDIRSTVRACGLRDGIRRLRADDGIRTRDPHLGKVMLYQLSHVRMSPLTRGRAPDRTGVRFRTLADPNRPANLPRLGSPVLRTAGPAPLAPARLARLLNVMRRCSTNNTCGAAAGLDRAGTVPARRPGTRAGPGRPRPDGRGVGGRLTSAEWQASAMRTVFGTGDALTVQDVIDVARGQAPAELGPRAPAP